MAKKNEPAARRTAQPAKKTQREPEQPRRVGRIRSNYLNKENGRDFDITEPGSPENRLTDPDSPSWFMPRGTEPHLRRRSGITVKDMRAKDVGRFKMSDFMVRATDERGHHTSLKVTMPQQMANELAAVCDSKVFPVRNSEALARTLIYEGLELLHAIARQDGLEIPHSHMQHLEAFAVLNKSMMSVLAYDDMLSQSIEHVRNLIARGVRNKARASVFEMLAIVEKINSRELRDRWTRDINMEFRSLIKQGKARTASVYRRDRDADEDIDENESEFDD